VTQTHLPPALLTQSASPARVEPRAASTSDRQRIDPDGPPQWFAMAGVATVGMTGVRVASWTASDLLFLVSSMFIVLRLLTGSRRNIAPVAARKSSPGFLIGLVVLTVGVLLATVFRSLNPAGSILALVRVWYITIIWFWTMRSVATSVRTFRRILLAAVLGAVAHSLIGIYQDLSGANAGAPGWGRSIGLSDHYGDLGISIGSMVPILAVWRREASGRPRRDMLRIVGLLVLLGGVASSGSMTPLAGAIVGTFVAFNAPKLVGPRRPRRSRRFIVPLAVALVAATLVATGTVDLAVQTRFEELTTGNTPTSDSAGSRASQAEVAFAGIVESPLVGVGLDTQSGFVEVDGHVNKVHSFYIRIAYEAGILGFLGLCLILLIIHRQAWQLIRYMRGTDLAWLPAGVLGSVATVLVSAFFGPVLYGRISWLPMALVSSLHGMARAGVIEPAPATTRT